jgi:hypothetical protein
MQNKALIDLQESKKEKGMNKKHMPPKDANDTCNCAIF